MVTVRGHARRITGGRFVPVKAHSRIARVKGIKGTFLLSRAEPWVRNPSGYPREDGSIRIPRTGQVYKGGKLQKKEVRGRHFYGAGR